jgi:hypothetical protein
MRPRRQNILLSLRGFCNSIDKKDPPCTTWDEIRESGRVKVMCLGSLNSLRFVDCLFRPIKHILKCSLSILDSGLILSLSAKLSSKKYKFIGYFPEIYINLYMWIVVSV